MNNRMLQRVRKAVGISCMGILLSCTGIPQEIPSVTLTGGMEMPVLGLGTYTLTGDTAVEAVKNALQFGYRHIDAAQAYRNEAEIYEGIRQSGLKREEVFVTSKISPKNMYTGRVRESLEESVVNLGGYIDLMLIHFPVRGEGVVEETWKIMEEFVDAGKIKAIGISSFKQPHIDSLMRYARIKPAVNQIEIHPYYNELELADYNRQQGIVTEGWSPFGSGKNNVLNDPVLKEIAGRYGRTVAQVILRWHVQHRIIAIPRTTDPAHMKENMQVFDFELSPEDMERIDRLNRNEMWNPLSDPDVMPWEPMGEIPVPTVGRADLPEYFPVCQAAVVLHIRPNPSYRAERNGISIQKNVVYADRNGERLHLTIVSPRKVEGKLPCIVMVPGSAWRKQVIDPEHAVDYARHGYVVAVVEYRHSGIAPFPAQVQDCKTAVRYMRKNADTYGVDTNNIFLLSDSSGGHTVLFAGTTSGNSELDTDAYADYSDAVNAVAAFYPPTDIYGMIEFPSTIDHNSPDSNEGAFLGGLEVSDNKEKAWLASPIAYVTHEEIPPVLLAVGTKDELVPANQSDRYALYLQARGKEFVFYNLVGASYGSSEFFTPEMVDTVVTFFNRYRKL